MTKLIEYALIFLKLYLIFKYGFQMKRRQICKKHKNLDMLLLYLGVIIVMSLTNEVFSKFFIHSFLVYYFFAFFSIFILFKDKIGKQIAMILATCCFVGILDITSSIAVRSLIRLTHVLCREVHNIVALLLTLVFVFVLGIFVPKNNKMYLKKIKKRFYFMILVVELLNTLILTIIWQNILQKNCKDIRINLIVVYIITLLNMYFQIIVLLNLAITNKVYVEKFELNQLYMKQKEDYNLYLSNTELETKKFRHDISNHMYIINQLHKENKNEELTNYLENICERMECMKRKRSVNHEVVDTIINKYSNICEKKGIEFDVKGRFPSLCRIESFDLCTLFTNLLQNAIESAEQCEKGFITLYIRYAENAIYINSKNSCTCKAGNNIWKTSKNDSENHGLGMLNMKDSVERYAGVLQHKFENHVFELNIFIQNKGEQ